MSLMSPLIPTTVLLILLTIMLYCNNYVSGLQVPSRQSWVTDGGRFLKYLWDDCSMIVKPIHNDSKIDNRIENEQQYPFKIHPLTIECLKRKSLLALDRALDADVIPLVDSIEMVRYNLKQEAPANDDDSDRKPIRVTLLPEENIENNMITEKNLTDWKTLVIMRLADVFRTHVVKINFHKDDISEFRSSDYFSARRRRHRHMMPIFMFGTIAMGMLLIPMGFKFLAVLGGKALLLAKMALLLASIQGLKRIATSSVNYGLYSQYPGWHERHGRVELLNGAAPYAYDTDPVYDRGGIHGPQQSDVQLTMG